MPQAHRHNRAIVWIFAVAAATVLTVVNSSAATHYVSQTSPKPTPPYSTPDTAAHNIQDAVDASSDGDTVLVAPGDYGVTNQINVTNAIRLQSTGGASQTFLTAYGGLGQGTWCLAISNVLAVADGFSFRPVKADPGSPGGAVLVGGTIQNCNFTNFFVSSPPFSGEAIVMSGGTVSNVIAAYNRGIDPQGVAVYCSDSGLITDSQILAIPGINVDGGAVALVNSRLQNSVISGVRSGGNIYGPAVSAISSTVVGCTISNNYSHGQGGAYLRDSLMDRCIVTGNTVGSTALGTGGGGVFETNSIIRNSLIVSNQAAAGDGGSDYGGLGGGVYMQGGALLNCTVTGNSATEGSLIGGGGGVFAESGGITNCIIYFNSIDGGRPSSNWFNFGTAVFDHCCTTPDPGGAGNITQDPRFMDMANGNFHLAPSSPCIRTGVVQPWMTGAQDLDGNPRTTNGRVDMGAYQFQPPSIPSITRSGSNIVLRWPSAGTSNLVLQQSSELTVSESWTPNTATVTDDGTNKFVTIPATNKAQFFRLR